MKKAILLISVITLILAGCKKDDIAEASKVRIETETIEKGWDYVKINVVYDYPVELESVTLYLSEKEDMSGAEVYECSLEGKKYSVELDSLKAGVAYYYCYEYDNGYEKVRCDVDGLMIITTTEVTNIKATTAICGGYVTYDGNSKVTSRGVCWSTKPNPTIGDSKTKDGSGTGSYTSYLSNLASQTTYYVRAYATNEKGTAYGEEMSFTTLELLLPTVTTTEVTNIKVTTATCGGYVSSDGNGTVTARGICWSTSQNPTINDNKTTDGSGTGSYTSNISNLSENTTYYVRAYATNEKGTSYGEQKSFTTLEFKNETFTVNGVTFTMIAVGGTFKMGATSEQGSDAYSSEKPVHSVTLSDYCIGETEVTQELWKAVMGSNPSYYSGSQKPVEKVSWNDCQEFITKLNNLTGKNFRLPTEAEWEYAARGGNKSKGYKYSGSNTIGNVAWYEDNSSSTHNVKTKQANEIGIYDMSGNVWEWCHDWKVSYSSGSQTNPAGPASGFKRVLRGGSYHSSAKYCRVSHRNANLPDDRYIDLGLRLALSQ